MAVPIYVSIADDIKNKIAKGEYQPGTKIPSERKLCTVYDVSRMTIRQAINKLVIDGYVYSVKGSGTFIAEKKIEKQKNKLSSFTEDMESKGLTPSNIVVSFEKMLPSEIIADRLRIDSFETVFRIERIRLANGEPMSYEIVYRPVKYTPELSREDLEGSLFEKLKEQGLTLSHSEQTIEAVLSNDRTSELLNIGKDVPLLVIKATSYLDDDTLLEYSRSYYRADMYKVRQTVSR
jgi:GntR family transcriptional regulator